MSGEPSVRDDQVQPVVMKDLGDGTLPMKISEVHHLTSTCITHNPLPKTREKTSYPRILTMTTMTSQQRLQSALPPRSVLETLGYITSWTFFQRRSERSPFHPQRFPEEFAPPRVEAREHIREYSVSRKFPDQILNTQKAKEATRQDREDAATKHRAEDKTGTAARKPSGRDHDYRRGFDAGRGYRNLFRLSKHTTFEAYLGDFQ